jgi:glutathionylspermidine amidase/synthetase
MTRFSMIGVLLSCLLLPQHVAEDVPFGTILGSSHGVDGFSNSNSSVITEEDNFVNGVFMGMKWQCVEYARRYLYLTKGMSFESVVAATNIWDLSTVTLLSSNQKYEFVQHRNGVATSAPKEGDLMIWPQQGNDTPFGHVAVVVGVEYNSKGFEVRLAEQNFLNEMWEVPGSHARSLQGVVMGEVHSVSDTGYQVTGWLSIGRPVQEVEVVVARTWDATMLGLLALPVFITVVGITMLAYKRRKVDGRSPQRADGHVLLDEDQVISAPLHRRGSGDLELENIR